MSNTKFSTVSTSVCISGGLHFHFYLVLLPVHAIKLQ